MAAFSWFNHLESWPQVLHAFSATDPTTGANRDGAIPDLGVVLDRDNTSLIGIAPLGGHGSAAGSNNSGGTLYELKLDDSGQQGKH